MAHWGEDDNVIDASLGPLQAKVLERRMRKPIVRKTIDYGSSIIRTLQNRVVQRDGRDQLEMQPSADFSNQWTPEGKRLVTGAQSGEMTLWSGLTFSFETILMAHDAPVRQLTWSHNDMWLVSGDETGIIKYWQSSMNNLKAFKAHKEAVRDISFSPTDVKFASCSDDKTVGIWDFERCTEDVSLQGHGWDVKSVHWHPQKALIIAGGKDHMVKAWDPRTANCLATIPAHKNTINKIRWNDNGMWFITCSRDQLIKVWDIRMWKEMQTCRAHKREVTSLAWHPHHERVFSSGSFDGTVYHWIVGESEPQAEICGAHDQTVWDLSWHPLGHMLASVSQDNCTRFWVRNRPGDEMKDKYNANQLPEEEKIDALIALHETASFNPKPYGRNLTALENFEMPLADTREQSAVIPGLGAAQDYMTRLKAERARQAQAQAEREAREAEMREQREKEAAAAAILGTQAPETGGASLREELERDRTRDSRPRSSASDSAASRGVVALGPPVPVFPRRDARFGHKDRGYRDRDHRNREDRDRKSFRPVPTFVMPPPGSTQGAQSASSSGGYGYGGGGGGGGGHGYGSASGSHASNSGQHPVQAPPPQAPPAPPAQAAPVILSHFDRVWP